MTYSGGKNGSGTYQTIINQMPPHHRYIEAFLGSGAIMRLKRPAVCSIAIDSDARATMRFPSEEFPGLSLVRGDAMEWLANNTLCGDDLVYLDPPYLMETRRSQRPLYACEFNTEEEHAALLALIKRLPCMVMISGYYSDLYAEALQGWRTVTYQAMTRGGTMATEWLWMNYPEPFELHDYRYLGANYRERERFKRKVKRWKVRLANMNSLERNAMMLAVNELRSPTSPETAVRDLTVENGDARGSSEMGVWARAGTPRNDDGGRGWATAGNDDACGRPSPFTAVTPAD